jgi:replication-associated recombination protein RarA
MDNLLLNPAVKSTVDQFVSNPSHALMLLGPSGAGKPYLAQQMLTKILGHKLSSNQYYLHIQPTNNVISIDEVRKLHAFTKLRTVGTQPIRRAILIEDAHCLGIDAQNVFLKLLEEPPADTIFILTVNDKTGLLPTIYSRTQHIVLKPVAKVDVDSYFFALGHTASDITRAYHIADGQIGLMNSLLDKGAGHPLTQAIDQAKQLLRSPHFERLAQVDALSKQKDNLPTLLWALERVCHAALVQATLAGNHHDTSRWIASEQLLLQAQANLSANPQAKLLLTNLVLNI